MKYTSSLFAPFLTIIFSFGFLAFLPTVAFAQTPVSGTLASDTTWTAANSPYVISPFGLTVPAGVTLTIQSGVVVKAAQSNTPLTIDGTLDVQGSGSFPVYFTSFNDTMVGGDTGFSPFGFSWAGISADFGATVHIDHAVIRNTNTGLSNNGGTVTVSNSTFENGAYGISHSAGTTSIVGSIFQNNQTGISSHGIGTISFTGNTFSNNSTLADFDLSGGLTFTNANNTANGTGRQGIFLYANGGNIANQTFFADSVAYVVKVFGVNIPATKTLTVEPGAIIKFEQNNTSLSVDGTLDVQGTTANPVFFTSFSDDAEGGDTDGTDNPPYYYENWGSITINSGATANFTHAVLRNGGSVSNNGGTLTISNSTIADSANEGLSHHAGTTAIASSTFSGNSYGFYAGGTGVISLTNNIFENERSGSGYFELSGGLTFTNSGNTAVGTGRHGFFLFSDGSHSSNQTLSGDNIPYVVTIFGITIPATKTLTVESGAIVKFEQYNVSLTVNGTLDVSGTSEKPVYFTSFDDDALGGDSDGMTDPPYYYHSWGSISIQPGATAHLTYAVLHRGGTLSNNGGILTVSNSEISGSTGYGILHTGGTTAVSHSSIHDNASYGIYNNTANILNAENNWWGSPTGPRHLSNPSGTGDRVSDNVDFTPWLGYDPTITAPLTLANPAETEDDNNQDAKGVADKTKFTFSVTVDGAPDTVKVIVASITGTTTIPLAFTQGSPVYSATSTFQKGKYTWHIEATKGNETVRTSDRNFTTGYSNVAFLPGLEASRLYRPATDPADPSVTKVRLWEPPLTLRDNSQLFLNANGTPKRNDIFTKDVIDEVDQLFGANIYENFIDSMNDLVLAGTIHAWKPLPYDWRFDVRDIVDHPIALATTSYSMTEEIQKLAESSDTGKVTIVTHSNGGLVAKVLANKLAPNLLDQMIFVASPQAGTPQAVGAILHGYNQGIPKDWLPLLINTKEARDLAVNMPSAYGLLPSAGYFSSVHDPVITFDNDPLLADWHVKYGIEIHSAEALHNFLADQTRTAMPVTEETKNPVIGNTTLLNSAENLHNNTLDNWAPPPGVTLTQIAGWGEDTLMSIVYYQGVKTTCTVPGVFFTCTSSPALEYKPKMVLDGDGTVVVPSALWAGAGRYWVDLQSYNETHFDRKHADILEVQELRDFIKNLIVRNSVIPDNYINTTAPPSDSSERLHFTLHSPLTLDLYDNLGNHTGISTTTGALEENIPGSRYRTFGEVKYISAPASTTLRLAMKGYATGSFTLDMEEVVGDTVTASTTFAGIPSATSTVATITIPDGNIANSSSLVVDENGDGTADLTLPPKQGGIVTLPKLTLTVTADNKTVTLGAPIPPLTVTLSPASNDVTGVPNCTTTATTNSTVGTYPITCTIGTLASNTYDFAFATGTLTVSYRFDGFLQPINDIAYHPTQSPSVFKGGSTVPVKFQLKKSDGTPVQANTLPAFSFQKGNAMSASVDESTYSDPATSGSTFKWDSTSQQYIYNWSTKGVTPGYWYKLSAKLDGGKTYSAVVGLR